MGWYGLIGSRVGGSKILFLTQVYPTLDSKGSHWKVTHLILNREYDIEIVTNGHVDVLVLSRVKAIDCSALNTSPRPMVQMSATHFNVCEELRPLWFDCVATVSLKS